MILYLFKCQLRHNLFTLFFKILLFNKTLEKIISVGLIVFSSLIGIRVVNEYLKFDNRSKYKFDRSIRVLNDGSKLHVAHPQNYNINSTGKDTVIFVSDSFGEGAKCGNSHNIAGCLSRLNPNKKIINLSYAGTSPAFYLKQIKTYIANQRDNKKNISGETLIVSLYSNDIVLDLEYCNFYSSKRSKFQDLMNQKEFNRVNENCDSLLSLSREEYNETKKFQLPFRNRIRNITGGYSYLLIRELIAQLSLRVLKDVAIGRAGYTPIWKNNNAGEFILLAEVLNEMKNICKVNDCKLLITTFPNVENLSPNSKVRSSLLSFSNFMKKKYSFIIHDGYEPFISSKILNARYSLTDIHSNCEGYQLYANWLVDLEY